MKNRIFIIATFFLAQAIFITGGETTTTDAQKKLTYATKSGKAKDIELPGMAILVEKPSNEPAQLSAPHEDQEEQGSPSTTLRGKISVNHLSITDALASSPSRSRTRSREKNRPYYQDHRPPKIIAHRGPVNHSDRHHQPQNNNQHTKKNIAKACLGLVVVAGVLAIVALLNPAPMPPSSCIINCTDPSFNVSSYTF